MACTEIWAQLHWTSLEWIRMTAVPQLFSSEICAQNVKQFKQGFGMGYSILWCPHIFAHMWPMGGLCNIFLKLWNCLSAQAHFQLLFSALELLNSFFYIILNLLIESYFVWGYSMLFEQSANPAPIHNHNFWNLYNVVLESS